MSLIIRELVQIVAPSYFKIDLTNIKDKSGNPIDLQQTGITFLFTDQYSNKYMCCYDPLNEHTKNCVYDTEENKLTLIFQDYKLRDRLKCKICSFVADPDFTEGVWKAYDKFDPVNISIKWQ